MSSAPGRSSQSPALSFSMRIAHSTSSCTCAGAVQILCAVSCCMQERTFPLCAGSYQGAQCDGLTAALPGLECSGDCGRPTSAGYFQFLVSSRCKPDCGDQAPILCMSAHSKKLACAFAYQSDGQRSGRWNTCGGRSSTVGSGVSQPSASVFRQNKNTPGFLLPGAFFIGDCEKLSWYRCSLSQAGCCRHR